jgi:hypothetical protein
MPLALFDSDPSRAAKAYKYLGIYEELEHG